MQGKTTLSWRLNVEEGCTKGMRCNVCFGYLLSISSRREDKPWKTL